MITLPYSSFKYDVDFLLSKQNVLHVTAWRYSFYLHIFLSLPVLLLGFMQVNKLLLHRSLALHRKLGKVYGYLVLIASAPSGLIMAIYANGGIAAQVSFFLIAVLWWLFTYLGVVKAKNNLLLQHRAFMYRSFALTLSAITLRSYVFIVPHFVHIPGNLFYVVVAWMSWMPNLLVAELIIYRKRNTPVLQ